MRRQSAPRFQLTSDLYQRLLPDLVSELSRQVLTHRLVARLNLYYKLQTPPQDSSYIPYLWTMLYDTIKLAIQQNVVAEYPADYRWIYLPGHPPNELQNIFNRKQPIFQLWRGRASDEASNHAEALIRSVFKHFEYKQPPHKFVITDETTGEECTPDVFTLSPVLTGVEVKNITSDVISDPSPLVGKPRQDLYTKIDRHFRLCLANGIHPLLIAPRMDPSFERYEEKHKGLHCEMFYQLMPPHLATLCQAVQSILLFPYVLAVDINPPFPPELDRLTNWVQHLPSFLAKYT